MRPLLAARSRLSSFLRAPSGAKAPNPAVNRTLRDKAARRRLLSTLGPMSTPPLFSVVDSHELNARFRALLAVAALVILAGIWEAYSTMHGAS